MDTITLAGLKEDDIIKVIDYSPKVVLHVCENFSVSFTKDKMPNKWWRFWQYVFFGFKWEKVK